MQKFLYFSTDTIQNAINNTLNVIFQAPGTNIYIFIQQIYINLHTQKYVTDEY